MIKASSWEHVRKRLFEWRGIWITAPVMTGLVLLIRFTGLLQTLEWAVLDEFFRRRPLEPIDSTIVIVGMSEADIRILKQSILSDELLAKLIRRVREQNPVAIGLDLHRNIPVPPGEAELKRVFETTPNLIGIEKKIGDAITPPVPPSPVLKQLGQIGVNDIVPDADGKLRRGLLLLPTEEGEWMESLGYRLAQFYLANRGIEPEADPETGDLKMGKAVFPRFHLNDGGYVRADDGGYQVFLNFRGPASSFASVSVMDVLQGRIPQNFFQNRIVLIGPMAPSLKDYFYTPYSASWTEAPILTAGVEIQANLASQIINSALYDRPLLKVWADPVEGLWVFFWASTGAVLVWAFRRLRWIALTTLFSGVVLLGGGFLMFLAGWWIPIVPPALAYLGSVVIMNRYITELEQADRKLVMNLFGRHVTAKVAEAIWRDRQQILTQGRVRGQQVTATVLFSDIKGFSRIAELTEPEVLMDWLNEYMEAMTQLVLDHGGIVDKFIGDAIMAVFGVPIPSNTEAELDRDAQQAVRCALAMTNRLEELNQQWKREGKPTAAMRIGISTGKAVIGSLGSSQRLDYTIIGDSVNVASRLESYDKLPVVGISRILLNEETYLRSKDLCQTKAIPDVTLRGREQPLTIYQVVFQETPQPA